MKMTNRIKLLILMMLFMGTAAIGQNVTSTDPAKGKMVTETKTFLIEREIPDAGKLTGEQLKSIAQKSCGVLKEMGSDIQWLHSYVTGNKLYCVYKAKSEDLIREHAKKGGFPANSIIQVASVINPATAN